MRKKIEKVVNMIELLFHCIVLKSCTAELICVLVVCSELVQIDRVSSDRPVEKSFTTKLLMGVSYVPLVKVRQGTSEL